MTENREKSLIHKIPKKYNSHTYTEISEKKKVTLHTQN